MCRSILDIIIINSKNDRRTTCVVVVCDALAFMPLYMLMQTRGPPNWWSANHRFVNWIVRVLCTPSRSAEQTCANLANCAHTHTHETQRTKRTQHKRAHTNKHRLRLRWASAIKQLTSSRLRCLHWWHTVWKLFMGTRAARDAHTHTHTQVVQRCEACAALRRGRAQRFALWYLWCDWVHGQRQAVCMSNISRWASLGPEIK